VFTPSDFAFPSNGIKAEATKYWNDAHCRCRFRLTKRMSTEVFASLKIRTDLYDIKKNKSMNKTF
jgi:hypothetical protein